MSGRIAAVAGVTVILAGCGGASRRQRLACRDLRRTFSRLRRRPTLARAAATRRIGSGLSALEVGLRLRYEVRREFARYLVLVWSRRFGTSATLALAAGENSDDLQFVAGVRAWF